MEFLYAAFFGAGVTAYAYTKLGRQVGYGNTRDVAVMLGVIFVLTTIVFFTILKFVIGI
jgi:hypothetical protein